MFLLVENKFLVHYICLSKLSYRKFHLQNLRYIYIFQLKCYICRCCYNHLYIIFVSSPYLHIHLRIYKYHYLNKFHDFRNYLGIQVDHMLDLYNHLDKYNVLLGKHHDYCISYDTNRLY